MNTTKNISLNAKKSPLSCWVIFLITGKNVLPDLVSQKLDLEADKTKTPKHDAYGEWQLSSNLQADEPVELHIKQLLESLLPVRHKLKEIRQDAKLEFYCFMESKKSDPAVINISPRSLLLIGHIGADLKLECNQHL